MQWDKTRYNAPQSNTMQSNSMAVNKKYTYSAAET